MIANAQVVGEADTSDAQFSDRLSHLSHERPSAPENSAMRIETSKKDYMKAMSITVGSRASADDEGWFVGVVCGVLFIVIAAIVLLIWAGEAGIFTHERPVVERALGRTDVVKRLQTAGITSIARGYAWERNVQSDALYISLNDGRVLHVWGRPSWGERRYILKANKSPLYFGAEPDADEVREVLCPCLTPT